MELPPRHKRRPGSIARTWLTQVVAYLGLWFIFTGTASKPELVAGIFCSCVAATLCEVVWSQPLAKFVFDGKLVLQALRLPWGVLCDTVVVLGVLARHLFGQPAPSLLRAVHFDAGREDDPHAATRRALAVALSTVTPNMIVVGIDQERGLLLFHQLQPAEVPALTRSLGAGP